MISGIPVDSVALLVSIFIMVLEVNNQMNTGILSAVNGMTGVT